MMQVNILHGAYQDALLAFLKKEDPDVITMQEVASDKEFFCNALGLRGVVVPAFRFTGSAIPFMANAVFVKGKILSHSVLWMRPFLWG